MSIHISSMVWKLKGISPAQRIVLLSLADTADDDGECWPGLKCVVEKTGLGRRSVNIHLQAMVEKGIVKAIPRYREDGAQTSNLYRFDINMLAPPHEGVPPVEAPCKAPLRPSSGPLEAPCKGILDPSCDPSCDPSENHDREFEVMAAGLVSHYAKTIKPAGDTSRSQAKKSVIKLIKGGMLLETLIQTVNNYRRELEILGKDDHQFHKNAGNFFGEQAVYKEYLPDLWTSPAPQENRHAERRPSAGSPITPDGAEARRQAFRDLEAADRAAVEARKARVAAGAAAGTHPQGGGDA